jgi:membrane dipeptidase
MFTIDLHLDLSMNAMEWNRDLRLPVADINAREQGKTDLAGRGRSMVSFPALREGAVGLVVATQIARYVTPGNALPGWHSPEQAWAHTQGQLAWYRAMEAAGELIQVTDRQGLETCVNADARNAETGHRPIGYILSLEGADSLVDLAYLDRAVEYGLCAIGPAHYGPGRYANGTDASGKMGKEGIDLLRAMDAHKLILDTTHLCDDAFWQAIDLYQGPMWASHQNCRSIVPHNRQLDDQQLNVLIDRGAVIGAAMDAWMIVPGWNRGKSMPLEMHCGLRQWVDHIDHICQLAGSSRHAAVGTDLDGGFGSEQAPHDLGSIAGLRQLPVLLAERGYSVEDIENILWKNAYRFLREALP